MYRPMPAVQIMQMQEVTTALINNLQDTVNLGDDPGRCARIAQQKYEEASMWAVKALEYTLLSQQELNHGSKSEICTYPECP